LFNNIFPIPLPEYCGLTQIDRSEAEYNGETIYEFEEVNEVIILFKKVRFFKNEINSGPKKYKKLFKNILLYNPLGFVDATKNPTNSSLFLTPQTIVDLSFNKDE
jgi:hypothetical protein